MLREALTRDDVERRKARDEALRHPSPPADHVVIFDEAQRAWNKAKAANFMKQRNGIADFAHSEPEFLIQYMDRHTDWAVIVCLVGGGQEIHTGEAGIAEWLQAATTHFPHCHLHVSSQLVDSEYAAGQALALIRNRPNVNLDEQALHLYVSMRSFRAERVSAFVKALLDCDREHAALAFRLFKGRSSGARPIRFGGEGEAVSCGTQSEASYFLPTTPNDSCSQGPRRSTPLTASRPSSRPA